MRGWTHFMALSAILMLSLAASRVGAETAGASADRRTPPVLSGCEPDYPPFCMVTPEGQADGFSVELLRAALKAVGREATFKTGVWSEIKADLAEGRLEVLPLVGRTPEREATYDFTFPYLTMHGTIVVRDTNTDIQGPADLRGKQVAVLRGDNAEEYLHRADLGAAIVPLPSFETALRGLSSGKVRRRGHSEAPRPSAHAAGRHHQPHGWWLRPSRTSPRTSASPCEMETVRSSPN